MFSLQRNQNINKRAHCIVVDRESLSFMEIFFSLFFHPYSLSEQSQNSFHHAHCYVPAEVKHVLDQKPSLISPIVRAFYERDPIDMKVHIVLYLIVLFEMHYKITALQYSIDHRDMSVAVVTNMHCN